MQAAKAGMWKKLTGDLPMATFLYIFEHVHNNFTNCSPANAADSFSGISSGLALIGLVGGCQLSQLLPGRGMRKGRKGEGGYKERRGLAGQV